MKNVVITTAIVLTGCYAAPPPPAAPGELTRCHPGSYSTLTPLACERDSDCILCATVVEPCGVLKSREQLALTNEPCAAPTAQGCGDPAPACCERHCVRSLGPPTF